jgi:hypothetical protein
MQSSEMSHSEGLLRIDVSGECVVSIFMVEETTLARERVKVLVH